MQKKFCLIIVLIGAPAHAGSVAVDIGNVAPGGGEVKAALCQTTLAPDACQRNLSVSATASVTQVVFPDVPPGRYAVAVFQDVDGTGVLRRGKLGIPLEPFGFSNGVGLRHRPTFEAAAFDVGEAGAHLSIGLHVTRRAQAPVQ